MLTVAVFRLIAKRGMDLRTYHHLYSRDTDDEINPRRHCLDKSLLRQCTVKLSGVGKGWAKRAKLIRVYQLDFRLKYHGVIADLSSYDNGVPLADKGRVVTYNHVFFVKDTVYLSIRQRQIQRYFKYDEQLEKFVVVKTYSLPI